MNPIRTLEILVERPEALAGEACPEGLGRTGMLGYAAGTLSIFAFLRMQAAVPPGVFSFMAALLFVLAGNFFFAGIIHLFMDLTGVRGSAARLFLTFGCSDLLLVMLLPLAFLAKGGVLSPFVGFCLAFIAVIYARVRLVRRLYPVSGNKALLSVWLPYFGLSAVFFSAFLYGLVWVIWLLI